MSQIMKAFTGVFFILLMMCSAIGLLNGFFQTIHAQNLHSAMITELENSDYAKPVIQECFATAETFSYELKMTLYFEKEGVVVCEDISSIPESCAGINMAELELGYDVNIAFFGVDVEQKLFGYGR